MLYDGFSSVFSFFLKSVFLEASNVFPVEEIADPKVRSIKLGPEGALSHFAVILFLVLWLDAALSWQQFLYFLPDPQGHGSLRPIFSLIKKPIFYSPSNHEALVLLYNSPRF